MTGGRMAAQRGECPECWGWFAVTVGGVLWSHRAGPGVRRVCPGSRAVPQRVRPVPMDRRRR